MKPNTKRTLVFLTVIIIVALALSYLILSDGEVTAHSKLPSGTRTPTVAVGDTHGVILAGDGSLWTWGDCEHGWHVLGLGTNVLTQPTLRRIGNDTNWVNVAVGGSTTLALKADGSIWGWGENFNGQLGNGSGTRDYATPVRAAPGNDWKQVACGASHGLALKRDGSLWSWGNDWAGQLGHGTTNSSRTPAQVGASTNWTRIWANLIQNVAQQKDGTLWFWGWDYSGSEKGSSISLPTRVSADTNWVDVGMGEWMVFAIKSDGTLWTWGRRAHVYSNATNTNQDSAPVQVGHDTDWRSCAQFGAPCPLFMKRDGSLWCLDARDEGGVTVVTKLLQQLVTKDQLTTRADNTVLGGDPSFGIVKELRINYQVDGTNVVATFREGSPVTLLGYGKPLKITRALYGDPKLFAEVDRYPEKDFLYEPARLRRVELKKDIAGFCGGRHGFGVALTTNGEVWQWGEVLGRSKSAPFPLPVVAKLLRQVKVQNDLDHTTPITLQKPLPLEKTSAE